MYFVNTNFPMEKYQASLPEKGKSKLLDDSPNIFKKSNIDCYM